MEPKTIFLPAAVLAMWTLLTLLLVPVRRFRAGSQGKVTHEDFKFGESVRVPPDVAIPNRAWMNLLEAPLLFYVATIIFFSIGAVDTLTVNIAWAYVAVRIVHTLIHVTYNKVFHRLTAFALSNVILVTLWFRVLTALLSSPATG